MNTTFRTFLGYILLPFFLFSCSLQASPEEDVTDEVRIRQIFDQVLTEGKCYEQLGQLCKIAPGRLSGSENAAKAVEYGKRIMDSLKLDKVWLQEVMVPHWIRGDVEKATLFMKDKKTPLELSVCALGGSVGTPKNGIRAEVIEAVTFADLERLGRDSIEGKIVFFNRPMDPRFINTFQAYGNCVISRYHGASKASAYGAKGVLIRSMSLRIDDEPHTGSMGYEEGVTAIPAAAISTADANILSKLLHDNPNSEIEMELNCETLKDKKSYNVIGEITGSEKPDEIIVFGGHLDSWDNGEGAHDDGAGCMQTVEVLRTFKKTGIKPKRTIRGVLFMNEENGLRGGKTYAEEAKKNKEKHIAGLESDAGGFAPRGFTVDGAEENIELFQSWLPLLEEYELRKMTPGGGGADISPLKDQGTVLIGLSPDSQRYFDFHHAATDRFENVHKRELENGAAAMTAMIYLLSEYGVKATEGK